MSSVHGLLSFAHTSGAPGLLQAPVTHVSVPSQKSPSGQGVPLGAFPGAQMPVAGTQVLAVQGLLSISRAHTTGDPGMQAPSMQVWPSHTLPSGQGTPLVTGVIVHAPVWGLHISVVHGLRSSQLGAIPG
jgi:hypothetical protein